MPSTFTPSSSTDETTASDDAFTLQHQHQQHQHHSEPVWPQQQQRQSAASIWGIDAPRDTAQWAVHFDDFTANNVGQLNAANNSGAYNFNHQSHAAPCADVGGMAQSEYSADALLLNGSADFPQSGYTDFDQLWRAAEASDMHSQPGAALQQQQQQQHVPFWQPLATPQQSSSNTSGKRKERESGQIAAVLGSEQDPDEEEEDEDEDSQSDVEEGSSRKPKVQRRQGVTCDACRSKHLRCDLYERRASNGLPPNPVPGQPATIKCTRCTSKQLDCTKNHAPPSRRYPRPSRTGKRIEQARLLHGSSSSSSISNTLPSELQTALTHPALGAANHADGRLAGHVMGATVSLRLLTCFFATAHLQLPVVDFGTFSQKYNYARGDARIMSIMSNGGNQQQRIPSCTLAAPGLRFTTWAPTNESTISTPGTAQTLIAVMHAWAAHYTDLPIAFGTYASQLGIGQDEQKPSVWSSAASSTAKSSGAVKPEQSPLPSKAEELKGAKQPKRKQGVACDTCRLRRVRCDVTEREAGFGCSRCQDKGIRCSTEYINSKRSASGLPPLVSDPSASTSSSSTAATAAPVSLTEERGVGPNAWFWKGRGAENRDWIDGGPKFSSEYQAGRAKEMLRWGKARKAFCHQLLSHAVALVHKYDILNRPSVEGTQCLLILAQVLDRTDPTSSPLFSEAATRHLITLGLEQAHEVHEQDQTAVEDLISNMQRSRIFYSAWGYSSVSSLLTRNVPHYKAERAIVIKGGVMQGAKANAIAATSTSQPGQALQLSGETGLSFALLAMLQIGALARFVTLKIDQPMPAGTTGPISPQQRFAQRYQAADIHRLQQACAALWRSLDSLLLFFDRCTEAARPTMSSLTTFQPLIWIANIKLAASMIELATFRILSERLAVQSAYVAAITQAYPATAHASPDAAHMAALAHLLQRSRERTLLGCRSTARLTEMLLFARVFQTGGTLVAQFSAICQFLIRTPPVAGGREDSSSSGGMEGAQQASPLSSGTGVDPRALFSVSPLSDRVPLAPSGGAPMGPSTSSDSNSSSGSSNARKHSTVTSAEEADESFTTSLSHDSKRIPVAPMPAHLPPFDAAAKAREVGALMEGLAQLGYSFDLEEVISAIDLLRLSNP